MVQASIVGEYSVRLVCAHAHTLDRKTGIVVCHSARYFSQTVENESHRSVGIHFASTKQGIFARRTVVACCQFQSPTDFLRRDAWCR